MAIFFNEGNASNSAPQGKVRQPALFLFVAARLKNCRSREDVREEWRWSQAAPCFFEQDNEVDPGQAGPSVGFGYGEPEPAEFAHLLPQVGAVALAGFHDPPDFLHGGAIVEEALERLSESVLIFRESEIHRRLPWLRRR